MTELINLVCFVVRPFDSTLLVIGKGKRRHFVNGATCRGEASVRK